MAEEENPGQNEAEEVNEDSQEEAAQPNKKKKIFIIAAATLILIAITTTAVLMTSSPSETANNESQTTSENNEEEDDLENDADTPESDNETDSSMDTNESPGLATDEDMDRAKQKYGETIQLKPFNLNLGNPLENRYIRLVIALEFRGGGSLKAELLAKTPKIRDIVVSIATKKTMEFLLGPDGKDHLRHELFVTINRSLENKIDAVYITDMLIE